MQERKGTVTMKGTPLTLVGPELKVGDKVVFSKYGGAEIKYQGEEYTIMHQSEILAVIE